MPYLVSNSTAAWIRSAMAQGARTTPQARQPSAAAGARILPFRVEAAADETSGAPHATDVRVFVPCPDWLVSVGATRYAPGDDMEIEGDWTTSSVAEDEYLAVVLDDAARTWSLDVYSSILSVTDNAVVIAHRDSDGILHQDAEGCISLGGGTAPLPFRVSDDTAPAVRVYCPVSAWLVSVGSDRYSKASSVVVSEDYATASVASGAFLCVELDSSARTWRFSTYSTISSISATAIVIAHRDSSGTLHQLYDGAINCAGGSGSGGGDPSDPAHFAELGSAQEGAETADTSHWTAGDSDGTFRLGLREWYVSRVVYIHTATTPVLWGFKRMRTYDVDGRLYSVSAEVRYEIDTPLAFEQEGY